MEERAGRNKYQENQGYRKARIKGDKRFYGPSNSKAVRAWEKRQRREQKELEEQLFIASGSLHIMPDKIIRCEKGLIADVEI